MEITCSQMDVLLSFYIKGDLSNALKKQVEEHLDNCSTCRAKYNIIKDMLNDIKNEVEEDDVLCPVNNKSQYRIFQNNLSAYVDNELPADETIKIKKYTINNKKARKDLEDTYSIRRLMSESFNKSKIEAKKDFTKNVIKQLTPQEEYNLSFHPVLKLAFAFILTVLVLSAIIVFSLTL